ncbi:hypothetical protein [Pseudorhodoplanes sinuspersici]|uniref:hypothetical protein n=1 Tax=Pseudorhodoplanes sinuspersici TaxID=1235591 RepID=UPI00315A6BCD
MRQHLGQLGFAGLKGTNCILELSPGDAIENGLYGTLQISLNLGQFFALADNARTAFDAQPVHLAGELLTKFPE